MTQESLADVALDAGCKRLQARSRCSCQVWRICVHVGRCTFTSQLLLTRPPLYLHLNCFSPGRKHVESLQSADFRAHARMRRCARTSTAPMPHSEASFCRHVCRDSKRDDVSTSATTRHDGSPPHFGRWRRGTISIGGAARGGEGQRGACRWGSSFPPHLHFDLDLEIQHHGFSFSAVCTALAIASSKVPSATTRSGWMRWPKEMICTIYQGLSHSRLSLSPAQPAVNE